MNRTQRAIKKNLRLAMNSKKKEKHRAIAEMNDSFIGDSKPNEAVRDLLKEEKGLRKWHRKCMNDYSSQNKSKEALAI